MLKEQPKAPLWTSISAHLFFLLQFVLAIVFNRERLYLDGSYYLYHILDSETFRIEHQRYILAVSQFLPLIGIWLGLKMKTIFLLQSLNPVIYAYGIFLACWYGLRDRLAGIAVILVQCLGIIMLFYCPMYEIWYGTTLTVLVYALMRHEWYKGRWRLFLFLAIEMTALFSHPLIFIPMLFLIVYDFLGKGRKNLQYYLIFLAMFVVMFIVKKLFLSDYESGKIGRALDFKNNQTYLDLLNPDYRKHLLKYLFQRYEGPVLLFLAGAIYYMIRRQYLKLLAYGSFFIGFIVFINIANMGYSNEESGLLERMYAGMVVIAVIPFLYDMLRNLPAQWQKAVAAILILLVGYREVLIIRQGQLLKKRTQQIDYIINCTDQQPGSKFIFDETKNGQHFIQMEWSFAMETILHSALRGKDFARSIVTTEDMQFEDNMKKLDERHFLARRWDLEADSAANPKYFQLKHGHYTPLSAGCTPE